MYHKDVPYVITYYVYCFFISARWAHGDTEHKSNGLEDFQPSPLSSWLMSLLGDANSRGSSKHIAQPKVSLSINLATLYSLLTPRWYI